MRNCLVCCLLLACASALADATYTNHYVWTNSADPGSPYNAWTNAARDIQTAVDFASAGDTVWVTNGIYTNSLNGGDNTNQVSISKALTLKSVNGAAVTVINGNYPYVTNRCIAIYAQGNLGVNLLDNCTIVNNRANNGGGVYLVNNSTGVFANTIIDMNTASSSGNGVYINNSGGSTNSSFTNCALQARADVDSGKAQTNDQCLFGIDFGFVNTNIYNYRLVGNSPCVNKGMNLDWITNAVDLAGNLRLRFGRVDMGAYEWHPAIKVNGIPYEKIRFINGVEPRWINGVP